MNNLDLQLLDYNAIEFALVKTVADDTTNGKRIEI